MPSNSRATEVVASADKTGERPGLDSHDPAPRSGVTLLAFRPQEALAGTWTRENPGPSAVPNRLCRPHCEPPGDVKATKRKRQRRRDAGARSVGNTRCGGLARLPRLGDRVPPLPGRTRLRSPVWQSPVRRTTVGRVWLTVLVTIVVGLVTPVPAAASSTVQARRGRRRCRGGGRRNPGRAWPSSTVGPEPVWPAGGGDEQYISESIVKLFTVAYYLTQAAGEPDPALAEKLRTMIIHSDDQIESSLWNVDIVPTIAARYGLANTATARRPARRIGGGS